VFQCLYTSGVARGGGVQSPHSHRSRFFHSRKVTVIKYYNLSLTTRRTINSHDLRKTNHLGSVIASTVECVLTWIREQYLVGCNIAKRTILCTVVHFQPVIKLHQKGVRVHHRRVILMEKMLIFSGEGAQPPSPVGRWDPLPIPQPIGASIILKFCLRYCSIQRSMWRLSTGTSVSVSMYKGLCGNCRLRERIHVRWRLHVHQLPRQCIAVEICCHQRTWRHRLWLL